MKWRWWKTGENFYYHFVLRENINFHCSDLLYSRWLQPLSNIHVIIRLSERNTSAIVFMKSTLLEFSMILEGKMDRENFSWNKMMLWKLWLLKQGNFHSFNKMFVKIFSTSCPNIQQTDKFHNLFKILLQIRMHFIPIFIEAQMQIHVPMNNSCYNIKLKIEHQYDCTINAGHPNTITIKCFLLFASSSRTLCSIYNIGFSLFLLIKVQYWNIDFKGIFMFILADLMWFDSWLKFLFISN